MNNIIMKNRGGRSLSSIVSAFPRMKTSGGGGVTITALAAV